jgi:hypothetical protein
MWNERGHSDMSGLLWLFVIAAVICFVVEGSFIALTVILWKHLVWRIVFGCLAIGGLIFIIHYLKEL